MPPRISRLAPASTYASGDEAIALAASAGLELDPWQAYALRASLGECADGKWAASSVGLIVSRQNGKGAVLTARELAGLFLFGERLILHSAHEFDTSLEAFARIVELIENTPSLSRRLKPRGISYAHGKEGITLKTGQRLRFKARTLRGGRGFSGDVVILDEAMYLQAAMMNSLVPTMAARPNPQLWLVGSAVDKLEHPDGLTFAKVRQDAIDDTDPSLTMLEWSAPPPPSGRPEDVDPLDESLWPLGNPGMANGRIAAAYIRGEQKRLTRRGFAVERMGVGDWPIEEEVERLIADADWRALTDEDVVISDPVAFAADVAPGGRWASITMAARTPDGRVINEVIADQEGTGWVAPRLQALRTSWEPVAIVLDGNATNAPVAEALDKLGIEYLRTSATDVAMATGGWLADVTECRYCHRDDPILNDAVANATTRDLAGGVALDRKGSGPISALVAGVLARYGLVLHGDGHDDAPPASPQAIDPETTPQSDLATVGF